MMKRYRYFVAYVHNLSYCQDGDIELSRFDVYHSVLNNTVVSVSVPIITENDVRNAEKIIFEERVKRKASFVGLRIISFQFLGEFEEGDG